MHLPRPVWSLARLSVTAWLFCALLTQAGAQEAQEVEPVDLPVVPPEVIVIPANGTAPPEAKEAKDPNAPKVELTPQQKRLEELLKLKYDRTAASILKARQELAGTPPAIDAKAEAFQLRVVAGRWKEVGDYVRTFPAADAAKLYEALLQELERPPAMGNPNQGQPQQGPTPAVTLLQNDVLELATAAPTNLTNAQIKRLGALLSRTLNGNSGIDSLLLTLKNGTALFGGNDPAKRELAAQLLIEAKCPREAVTFLPPLPEAVETASPGLLEKHIACAQAEGRQEQKEAAIQRAWNLNQVLLRKGEVSEEIRERAWHRCADLIRFLPAASAVAWVKEALQKHPAEVPAVLLSTARQVAADRMSREASLRKENLELQHSVVEAALSAQDQRASWQAAVDLFALNWLEEADYAKRIYVSPRTQMPQYDEYGNRIYYGNQMPQQPQQNPNQLPAVPMAELLAAAPNPAWLAVVDPSLKPRILTGLAELCLKFEEDEKALPYVEQLAALQPKVAQRLGGELLRLWATLHDPQRSTPRRQGMVYYNPYNPYGGNQGIPLTRALQKRNLDELGALLQRLRKLPIEPLDDSAIVAAFTMAHSQAEVFREESIEQVLGKVDALKPQTLWELLHAMRQRLASQWRKPSVQQQAKTQRSDQQVDVEVLRGYELLSGLVERGLKHQPDDWRLNLAKAATSYDWAEFQYGKKVDLSVYVQKREQAFDAFQRAADLYAAGAAKMEPKDETPLIYQLWLNANLGASDLAMVTRQQEPSAGSINRIAKALDALPPAAAERHRDALAKLIVDGANQMPAHLKPGYMRSALTILGKRPAAVEIESLVSYYDGLLQEVEATLRVDGENTVGHGVPFGAFFTVRHTAELERENAGGFGKYLRNQSQNPYYYNPYGTPPIDHRDDLEKQIREKLSEGFEILSLTFHDEKVQSRAYGRAGWRETPLLYLLLKAKDASVDRLPAIRLDLDFVDKQGPVVLPTTSAVQLVDARSDRTPQRPVAELELAPILDARSLGDGKLSLEIKATGKGLIPTFQELFDFAPAGFKIDETTDSGPAVVRLDSEGDGLAAVSERTWLIKMSADPSASASTTFHFPTAKLPVAKVAYKRYEDSDLVEVSPELALQGLPLRKPARWPWVIGGIGVIALGVVIARSKRRIVSSTPQHAYALPSNVTPFTMLNLLRRIQQEKGAALSPVLSEELGKTIIDLESRSFAPKAAIVSESDLVVMGRHWIDTVRKAAR